MLEIEYDMYSGFACNEISNNMSRFSMLGELARLKAVLVKGEISCVVWLDSAPFSESQK